MAEKARSRNTVLTLRVNEPEEREFRLLAKAEGVSVSEMIRTAVRERAMKLAARRGATHAPR